MKKNYSKAEKALEMRLQKMEIDQLYKIADIAQKVGKPELRNIMERTAKAALKTANERKALLYFVRRGLEKFGDSALYKAVGLSSEELKALVDAPTSSIKADQWKVLSQVKVLIAEAKERYQKAHPQESDQSLVAIERKKHINKRFNVNEKWLPLK